MIAGLLLCVTVGRHAQAYQRDEFFVGDWSGYAYFNDETHAFSHCALAGDYKSNISLVFVWSESGLSLGLSKPRWKLDRGASYQFHMRIDSVWEQYVSAYVFSDHGLRVDFGFDRRAINAFKRGYRLTVSTEGETFRFKLTGTAHGLARLNHCYSQNTRSAAANPFAGRSNPFKQKRRAKSKSGLPLKLASPSLPLDAYKTILDLASDGAGNSSRADGDLAFAHYMTVVGGRALNLYWEESNGGRSSGRILSDALGHIQAICGDRFASGHTRRDNFDGVSFREGFVACDDPDWRFYTSVSVFDFSDIVQIFITIGAVEHQETIDLINANIAEYERNALTAD